MKWQAKLGALAATLALAMSAAHPASAQISGATTRYAGGSPEVLSIPVYAQIGSRCGFADGGKPAPDSYTIPTPIDTTAWTKTFPFELECTGPFRVGVVSSKGGLENGTLVTDPGYTNLAPYSVELHVVGDGDAATETCTAASLKSDAGTPCNEFRGPASEDDGLGLNAASLNLTGSYLRAFGAANPAGTDVLINGSYSDTLTVTVSAAVVP